LLQAASNTNGSTESANFLIRPPVDLLWFYSAERTESSPTASRRITADAKSDSN
jgi:hypothetical protein